VELAIESVELSPNRIELALRNTGPDAVEVSQAFVNDAFVDFTGATQPIGRLGSETVALVYPWQEGQPYLISLVSATGVVIEHEIAAAIETPRADGDLFALMALLGTYVGVIPVALGMLLLPGMRRFGSGWIRILMAVTIGLLAFLAVDATLEGLELGGESAGAFGGAELLFLGAGLSYLLLTGLDRYLRARSERRGAQGGGGQLALMIAIGIGLHNMGEGLAIGSAYAIGELALGAFGLLAGGLAEGLGAHHHPLAVAGDDKRIALISRARLAALVEGVEVGGPAPGKLLCLTLCEPLPGAPLDRLAAIVEGATSRLAAHRRRPCEWRSWGRFRCASAGWRFARPRAR